MEVVGWESEEVALALQSPRITEAPELVLRAPRVRKKERKNSCKGSDENEKEISSSSHGIMASIGDGSKAYAKAGRTSIWPSCAWETGGWLVHVAEVLGHFEPGGGASSVPVQPDAPSNVQAGTKAAERWISNMVFRDERREEERDHFATGRSTHEKSQSCFHSHDVDLVHHTKET